MIDIYTDGGSRGNPGPSAIGVIVKNGKGEIIFKEGKQIGNSTNNAAEYSAAIEALSWTAKHKEVLKDEKEICFYTDSQLMYSQIIGIYKIKNEALKKLLIALKKQEGLIGIPVKYFHVRRENNKDADRLVNMALDKKD